MRFLKIYEIIQKSLKKYLFIANKSLILRIHYLKRKAHVKS
jgi:hypothetical protein